MTGIVRFKTKTGLKAVVQQLNDPAPAHRVNFDFWIQQPSPSNAADGRMASTLKDGEEVVVTNHPKRSWFAQVGRRNGRLYVK